MIAYWCGDSAGKGDGIRPGVVINAIIVDCGSAGGDAVAEAERVEAEGTVVGGDVGSCTTYMGGIHHTGHGAVAVIVAFKGA